jgi:hypothetical protein
VRPLLSSAGATDPRNSSSSDDSSSSSGIAPSVAVASVGSAAEASSADTAASQSLLALLDRQLLARLGSVAGAMAMRSLGGRLSRAGDAGGGAKHASSSGGGSAAQQAAAAARLRDVLETYTDLLRYPRCQSMPLEMMHITCVAVLVCALVNTRFASICCALYAMAVVGACRLTVCDVSRSVCPALPMCAHADLV